VAANAVRNIGDTLPAVFGDHFSLVVAAVAGPCHQVGRMAVATGSGPAMSDRESVRALKQGRRPTPGGVAGGAARAEQAQVVSWLSMAGDTRGGRAGEDVVDVALGALQGQVSASQRESRFRVVKRSRQPGVRCVAGAAIRTELPVVGVVFGVTGVAILRRALEDVINMAGRAVHGRVRPHQLKGG